MNYRITNKGLLVIPGVGVTKHWNKKDLVWLKSAKRVAKNAEGYVVMPYGNVCGADTYIKVSQWI